MSPRLPPERRPSDARCFYALVVLIALQSFRTALPGWAHGIIALGVIVLFTLWALSQAQRRATFVFWREYRSVAILSGLVLGYLGISALPLPAALIEALNPGAMAVHRLDGVDGTGAWATLSLDSGLALRDWLRTTTYFVLLLLVVALVRTSAQLRVLAFTLVSTVSVHALWGLIELYATQRAGGRANGLFPTANLYAGFVEMGLGMAMGLLFGVTAISRARRQTWRQRGIAFIDAVFSIRMVLALTIIVLLAALFASGSRGGAVATVAAVLTSLVVLATSRRFDRRAKRFIISFMVVAALSLSWLGADTLSSRLDATATRPDDGRLAAWTATLAMVRDYPVFGIGGAAWRYLHPRYEDPELRTYGYPPHAHNDHLQMVAEHGMVGYLLFGSFVAVTLWNLAKAVRDRRDPMLRGIAFGSLTATLAMLLHGFTDYNFQRPTAATYFFVVLGLGLVASRLKEGAVGPGLSQPISRNSY